MPRPDLALMMFDFSVSGVVRNAMRIAGAAQQAGIRVELWVARDDGELRSHVPPQIAVRGFGASVGEGYSRAERKIAVQGVVPAFAAAMAEVRPRMACSAGNHFHDTAVRAHHAALVGSDVRLIGRFSNALPRFSWSPEKLPSSLWKRISARRRLAAMDRLVAVSSGLAADLQRELLLPAQKIVVISNGIDLAAAQRRAAEPLTHPWLEPGQPPIVLGVGRLVPQKNFDGLIRAFAVARKARPMRLILIGEGPERPHLERLARERGMEADIELAGFIENPLPYYARSALFVLPSRWEGMSNALLEAMAVGCPVLATRCSGSVELLGEALADRIVDVSDEQGLAQRIGRMLQGQREGAPFRERASEFDLSRTLRAYVGLFQRELSDQAARGSSD
jgi:glycosyltransferase involved in cell wall biosynthesis